MSSLVADLRYGWRVLSKKRSFTVVAVATLALGIGANTAIFSMANAIVYHPYPFPDLDRMVALWETIPKVTAEHYAVSPGNYFDWVDRNHSFSQMAAYRAWDATLTGPQGPQPVRVSLVSPGFFRLLRLSPIMGRIFVEESRENDRNQIVLSYGFWQQRLGADRNVVGSVVVLNGLGYTVIGVMPKDFDFPMYTEIWAPWITTPQKARSERTRRDLNVVARLKPGVSLARAQAGMNGLGERLAREYPLANAGRGISVKLLRDSVDEYAGRFMAVVTGAVAFLLLLVCANVANLQLARGAGRRKEMALRVALGAGRARIVGQLLTEGLLLSALGAGLGLPLAIWGLALIKANLPQLVARHLPGLTYARLDSGVLAFTMAAAVVTGVVFTLPVAVQSFAQRLHETLKEGVRGSTAAGGRRMRSLLVVSEIAFAVVLLIGAGLMVKGFRSLATIKQGFNAAGVLTFHVTLPESQYQETYQVANFYQETLRRLSALSEIRSAAVISELPALGDSRSSVIIVEGQPMAPRDRPLLAEVRVTSEDYFRTLAIPVLAGRALARYDNRAALPVAVISKSAARRFWPREQALGRRVSLASGNKTAQWLTVVGIAGD